MIEAWLKTVYTDAVPNDCHGGMRWQSPSNIALVKYWGKRAHQLPQNPSVSFTLSRCRTETTMFFEKSDRFSLSFFFEGKENRAFGEKIERFLCDNLAFFPFLKQFDLRMESRNTFPHSSGIASSASSMSAMVMSILELERQLKGTQSIDLQKASYFSRLASGSASRSVYPEMALWGKTDAFHESTDEYAVSLADKIHPVFRNYCDTILIVSDSQKQVSSRAGHALMETNPYATTRYRQANENVVRLLSVLAVGDLDAFVQIAESEALQLHALMMCSNPSFILLKPNTIGIIEAIRNFRAETKLPICFTLDAGPNVHLLYPNDIKDEIRTFVKETLCGSFSDIQYIDDCVGKGPSMM